MHSLLFQLKGITRCLIVISGQLLVHLGGLAFLHSLHQGITALNFLALHNLVQCLVPLVAGTTLIHIGCKAKDPKTKDKDYGDHHCDKSLHSLFTSFPFCSL